MVTVTLYRLGESGDQSLGSETLNKRGRSDKPLADPTTSSPSITEILTVVPLPIKLCTVALTTLFC